jgi:hypothetical protein
VVLRVRFLGASACAWLQPSAVIALVWVLIILLCHPKMARQAQPPAIFLWIPFCHEFSWEEKLVAPLIARTPSSEAHLVLFGGKKKSQNKNFDDHIRTI